MPDYVGPYSPEYYDPVSYYPDNSYRPWWYDIGVEAIRRGAETAQVIGSGWPSHPPPVPQIQPQPLPAPYPLPGVQPQARDGAGIQLSTNTLLIGGLILFAFIFGSRKGR